MHEFGLVNHNWFSQLFELHRYWIPAYFSKLFMGGLLRQCRVRRVRTIYLVVSQIHKLIWLSS